jgi:hypothetical protein
MSKEQPHNPELAPEFQVVLPNKDGAAGKHVRVVQSVSASPKPVARPVAPKRNFSATLRLWHHRAGLAAFIFLGWLGFSGILLNEASDLGLNSVRVGWTWLMAIYGLHAEAPEQGYGAGDAADRTGNRHWLAVANGNTLLDGKPLAQPVDAPVGFAIAGEGSQATLFVATADSVVLLTPAGGRIDELRMPPLPISSVRRIGIAAGGGIAIQGTDAAWRSTDQGESWKPVPAGQVQWSAQEALPDGERKKLMPYSRPSVALQQILVDAHSGRLFGPYGTYVIDVVGILAMVLAGSGVWMVWRTNRSRRRASAQR